MLIRGDDPLEEDGTKPDSFFPLLYVSFFFFFFLPFRMGLPVKYAHRAGLARLGWVWQTMNKGSVYHTYNRCAIVLDVSISGKAR